MRTVEDAAARIRAAREAAKAAGVPIVINARTDLYIKNIGDEAGRFDEAVTRARAYLAAGADCFYPIALRDTQTIGRLVQALNAPVNINVRAGYPGVAELEALGVRRITTATQLTLVALEATRRVVREIKRDRPVQRDQPRHRAPRDAAIDG
jgi:2-methylisocitrate lyase-like PEP mutase family enzyme